MTTRRTGSAVALVVATVLLGACSQTREGAGSGVAQQPQTESEVGSTSGVAGPAKIIEGPLKLRFSVSAATEESSSARFPLTDQLQIRLSVADGTEVELGDRVGRVAIVEDVRTDLVRRAKSSSVDAAALSGLKAREGPALAPVAGRLTVASDGPFIEAKGLDAVAALTPVQLLRVRSMQFTGTAQVETLLGPRQVKCDALWALAVHDPTPEQAGLLHCRLPRHVESAAGLRSSVVIEAKPIPGKLAPAMFVGHDPEKDEYFLNVRRNDAVTRVVVQVGATNGVQRIVAGKIRVGDSLAAVER